MTLWDFAHMHGPPVPPLFFVNFLKMYIGNVGMNSVLYFVLLFPQRFLILLQSCQSHCLKQL